MSPVEQAALAVSLLDRVHREPPRAFEPLAVARALERASRTPSRCPRCRGRGRRPCAAVPPPRRARRRRAGSRPAADARARRRARRRCLELRDTTAPESTPQGCPAVGSQLTRFPSRSAVRSSVSTTRCINSVWCSRLCSDAARSSAYVLPASPCAKPRCSLACLVLLVQMHARSFESNDQVDQSRLIAVRAMSSCSSSRAAPARRRAVQELVPRIVDARRAQLRGSARRRALRARSRPRRRRYRAVAAPASSRPRCRACAARGDRPRHPRRRLLPRAARPRSSRRRCPRSRTGRDVRSTDRRQGPHAPWRCRSHGRLEAVGVELEDEEVAAA